jgi:hypothetical protein
MSKLLILGLGSIGRRHAANLHTLGYHVIAADPFCAAPEPDGTVTLFYRDFRRALADHGDSAGVVIASPTAEHHAQVLFSTFSGPVPIPVYVEKPSMTTAQSEELSFRADILTIQRLGVKSVTGFQYFFHPQMPAVHSLALRHHEIAFRGNDDLLARYGKTVGEIMVAHPIASALRFFGPAGAVELRSNGIALQGTIIHQGGCASHYDFDMSRGPRESWAGSYGTSIALTPDPSMYVLALSSWLDWLDGGPRDPRLSSLAEGLEVSRVLSQVARVEGML